MALLAPQKWAKAMHEYRPVSDRILVVSFNMSPFRLHIVQMYDVLMGTADTERSELGCNHYTR